MEQQENVEKARKWLILVIAMWYNVVRHYTSADSRPTRGRTISKANRVHPAEHSMSEGHVIMSSGIPSERGYFLISILHVGISPRLTKDKRYKRKITNEKN